MIYKFTLLLGLLLFTGLNPLFADDPPVMSGNETSSPQYFTETNTPVALFPDFTIKDLEDDDIKGLTIHFSSGYQSNQDTLLFTNTSKIEGHFDDTQGALVLLGDASPDEYQAAMRSITYVNNAPLFSLIDGTQRQFTISLANDDYFSQNSKLDDGHFYEYINDEVNLAKAKAAASAKTYYGLQGYLSTITSAEENSFITDKTSAIIWLDASDKESDGTWKWLSGPESGDELTYFNWASGEPNGGTSENNLMIYPSTHTTLAGKWNDIITEKTYRYVVEYGGMPGDPTLDMTTTTTLKIDVVRPEAPGGIVDNLALWLNAEEGFTYTSPTDAEWIDQSRNKLALNVNLIQSPASGTVAPVLAENSNNFNSTLVFDGANTGLASAINSANFDFSEMTVFSVQQVDSGKYSHTIWHYDNDGHNNLALFVDGAPDNKFNIQVNDVVLGTITNPLLNDDIPHLIGFASNASSAEIYMDAAKALTVSGQPQLPGSGAMMIGMDADGSEAQDGGNQLKGNVGEVIFFNKKLSASDQQKVGSYLALKYGISLSRNYIASDGTASMWTNDSDGYNQDVFGIGRDDASGLNQKISKSVSAGTVLTVALDADFISANNDVERTGHTNNLQFLTIANNGAALAPQFTEVDQASGFNVRLAREWKVDATDNFTQNISLKFEGSDDEWTLYKDSDGDFSSGATALGTLDANGEITNISLADGDYLTLGKRLDAPGGVFNNLRVWFNANSGTTNGGSQTTNGNITSWEGQIVQSTNIAKVADVYGDPAVVPNSVNFNSVVSFDGDDAIRTSTTAPYTTYFNSTEDKNTAFLVKKTTAGKVEAGYGSATGSRGRAGYFERAGGYQRIDYGEEPTIVYGNTTTINKYVIARQDVQTSELSLYLDGTLETQTSDFSSLAGSSDGHLGFGANPQDFLSAASTTDIAEYIIYAADLSDTEVKEVESYLALKYGISKAGNYFASDGSTIWSGATDNTGYDNDIFGIGRDDASGLNQKVSKSVNAGSILTIALNEDFTSANNDAGRTTHANDLQFLTVANNGAVLTPQVTELDATTGFNIRLAREWKVDATNFAQNISMKFEGYDEDWSIIATSDGDFSSNVTTVGTLNADGEFTTTAAPADGTVFTLAKYQEAPGGVTNGISLWIKANNQVFSDLGITGATNNNTIEQWNDQSPYGNHFTQVNTEKPTFLENSLNFNPQVYFNGTKAMNGVSMTGLPSGSDARLMRVVATQTAAFTGNHVLFAHGTATDGQAHGIAGSLSDNSLLYGSWGGENSILSSNSWTLNKPHIIGGGFDGSSTTYLQADGATLTTDADGAPPTWNTVNSRMCIGADIADETGEFWTGNIAEVVVYSANVSASDQQKIDSYLALKYGVTLDQTDATDYLASDGTAIWKAANNTGYTTDIFGIGQDNASSLNQKVSRSVNNANGPILATIQNFTASNTDGSRTELGNGNFMLMGHNNGTENSFTAGFNSGTNNRTDRIWKVDETGTVGEVYFAIPYAAVTFPSGGTPSVIISDDENFDDQDQVLPLTYNRTQGGYYARINPDDGDYIALAISEISVTLPTFYRTESIGGETTGITSYPSYADFINNTNSTYTTFSQHWNFDDSFFADGVYFYRTNNAKTTVTRYPSLADLAAGTNGIVYNFTSGGSPQDWNDDDEFFASGDQFFRTASSNSLEKSTGLTVYNSFADLMTNTNGTFYAFTVNFNFEDQFFHDGEYFYRTNTNQSNNTQFGVARYASLSDLVASKTIDSSTFGPWSTNDDIFAVGITASFSVSKDTLTMAENAGKGEFTVVLDARPSTDVVLDIASDDTNEATVDKGQLTFTPDNWKVAQTITVTGVDDYIIRNDSAIVTVSVNTSSDNTFAALANQSVEIILEDDDVAGFTLSESTLIIDEDAGTASFTVVLNTQPISNVVFDVLSDDDNEAIVNNGTLTFTSGDWDTPQTITVTGVNDEIDREDDATITVSVEAASSDDTYDGEEDQTVAVTLTDDDEVPTVSTTDASSVISTSGVLGGNITDSGTSEVTETGVVYSSKNDTPEIGGTDVTKDVNGAVTGEYSETIESLAPNTTYYYQAYAISNAGISYGGVLSFKTKQTQVITFDELADKTYGDSDFDPEATASSNLIIAYSSSDTTVATIVDGNIHIVGAGSCTIYADQSGDDTYDAAIQVSQPLTVNKKPVTVTAEADQSKVYGESDPTLTYATSEDLETGDSFSGVLSRVPGDTVGTYAITIGTLSAGSNYDLTFVSKDFSITEKAITVTAEAGQTKVYGESDPTFTYTTSASLEAGDSFTGALSRATGEDVGNYGLTVGTLSAGSNYDLTFVSKDFSITRKSITVTAEAGQSKVYGESDPTLTYASSEDLETGDSFSGVLSRVPGDTVGTYAITIGTLSAGSNYDLTFVSKDFSITRKSITVTAEAGQSKVYGESDPTLTYASSEDLETGDSFSGVLSRVPGDTVGTYAITIGTLSAGSNYDLTFVSKDFSITRKSITVTAEADQSKVYGESDPTLTYATSEDLETGDSFSGVLSRVPGDTVGTYAITIGTLSAGSNYDLTFVSKDFSITRKSITVTAEADQSKVYGESDPTLTYATSEDLETGDSFSGVLSRVPGDTVGTYAITIGTLSAGSNYDLTFVSKDFSITRKSITVTAEAGQTKVYGESDPTFTYTTSASLEAGDSFTGALSRATGEDVGNYGLTVGTLSAGSNYDLTFVSKDFSITRKSITVTAEAGQTKVYGESDPTFTYTTSASLEAGDSFTGALSRATGEDVGNYGLTVGTLSAGSNYDLTFVSKDFSITRKSITVTAEAGQTKVYGESDPTFTYTTSASLEAGDSFTGALSRATGEDVGNYGLTVGTLSAGSNYDLTFVSKDFSITRKSITVTAEAGQSKVYGESDPTLTYASSEDLETGDSFSGVLSRVPGDTVGTYAITIGTLSAGSNYDLTFVSKDFSITRKSITVTAEAGQTKVYGESDPTFTYTTSASLEAGDSFTGALSRATGEDVGNYGLTVGTLSAGSNYDLTFVSKDFSITRKSITVTAEAGQSKVYGESDPTLTYASSEDLETGDSFSGVLSRVPGDTVGTYAITIGTLSAGSNYDLTFVSKDFSITRKSITVTAEAGQTKVYGESDPTFTYTTSASLEAGDSFTGALSRATGEDVGNYGLTVGTLSAGSNYDLTFVSKDFSITRKSITVTAEAGQSKVYGESDPTLTYASSEDLETGDSFSGVLSRVPGDTVGTYAITIGTLSAGLNYDLTFVSKDFSITRKSITVTAEAGQTKVYGESDPTFTYTTSASLEAGDSFTGALSRATGEDVGNYGLTVGTLSAGSNYDLTFVSKDFSITRKSITVTAEAGQTKVYGESDPTFTYTTSASLEAGDSFTGALSRATGEDVGNYGLTVGTLSAGSNYDLTFVSKDFSITRKSITVTAEAGQTKVYGESDPTFTYTTSASLEAGDSFTGALSRATGEDVGNYGLTVGTLSAGSNYDLTFVSKDFSITRKSITVTAEAGQTKVYGESDPTFTYTTSASLEAGDSFTGALSRATGEDVGNYGLTVGTLSAGSNYDLTFVSKDFSITRKSITVTAEAGQTKVYGESDPTFTYTTSASLEAGDSFTGALSRATGEDVGNYGLTVGTLSAGSNYDLTFVSKDFSITRKSITVTAEAGQTKVYGESDPTFTYTTSASLEAGDSFTGALSRATGEDVGNYGLTVGTLSAGSNYDLTFVSKDFSITRKSITVTAEAGQTKVYGESDPTFTYTTSASLEAGDSFTGALSRATGEDVGNYGLTVGTLSAGSNYDLTFVSKDFSITEKAITVTADAKSKVYGETDPALTYQITAGALVGSDALTGSLSRDAGEDVGSYPITIGSLSAGTNYDFTFESSNFTINKKTITATAADKSKTYGEDNPELTFTYSGFVNGDNESDLTKAPVASTEATAASVAGNYKITVAGGVDENYDFTYNDATLTIEKATLTVTATAKDKSYDGTTTASITLSDDRVSGDMLTIDTTSAEFEDKNVGEGKTVTVAGIILSGDDANNYELSSATVSATADITPKNLTVSNAIAQNKIYDGTTDAVISGAVLKGVVLNDDVQLENETIGTFAQSTLGNDIEVTTSMTLSGVDAPNYLLVQPTGLKADITGKELTITGAFTVSDKEYDGTTNATVVTNNLELSGIEGEDDVTLSNVVIAFETASAGSELTVKVVSADLTGDAAAQYSLSLENSPTATASILLKEVTLSGANGITKTYDGNILLPSGTAAYGELNGILAEDETQVELTGNPLFDLADAGDRVIVQGSLRLTGSKADNYTFAWTDGTGEIEKATLTVVANNDAKFVTLEDEESYAGVSISGYVNGENSSVINQTGLTITRSNATENSAGEYTDVLEASGLTADNYVFNYLPGDYSIIPAEELLVEINDTSIAYSEVSEYGISSVRYLDSDGNTIKNLTENVRTLGNNQFSVDDGVGNVVSFTISEIDPEYNSQNNRLAVGAYQLEATAVSGSSSNFNNTIHVTGVLTVTTKEVEVQLVSGSEQKAFDGDANMDNLDMFTSDLVNGDDVELLGNGSFSQSEAGTDIAYSVTFALQGADKDNYHLKTDVPITGNDGKIAQIELTVTDAKASNKVYDGTTTATITGATLNGAITGDDVTLANENTGAFVTDAVGNDIEILTSMTLAGADKDNYVLIQPSGLKARIEPQELTVANAAAKNKVYDGTTDATIVDATLSGVVADDEVLLENAESGTFKQDIVGTEIEVTTVMTISGADASNYYLIQPIGITADITTRELTVKDAVAESKIYDGTVNAVVSGAVLDGYISGDDVILANSTVGTFMQNSVGENIQVVTLMTLEGDDKDNYTLKQPSYLTANITAAELTLSGSFVVNNKEYDGTAIATMLENNLQFNGLASGDIVSLDNIMLAFETSNAGTGLEVYITEAKISGSDASKYSFSLNGAPVTSASINKKELTVTADDKTKEYDGSGYSSFTVSYNGFIDGEDETNLSGALSFAGTATTAINAGIDYTITPGGLSSENYAIMYVDGYLDIQKVDQTITFSPISQQILSNSSFELSAVASSGLTIEYSSSDESIATVSGKIVTFINSGTCTIYANQPGNVNYNAAEQVLQTLTIIPYISGDSNHDGKITPPEIAGDSNEDGQINDGEVAGDTNGDGQIGDDEVAGDTDGNGQINGNEVAGDNNGDGKITEPEVAGDTNGNGQIDDDEVAGDNNGDGKITEPEVAGDTNGNGQIDDDEVAGDNNGDGKITEPEVAGDTDGNGQINGNEVAGDNNGDGKITEPEVAGDTDGNGQINDDEVAGDNNGDGQITEPEVAGDTDGNGQINVGEVAGDNNGDGKITEPEVAGDTDGNGQIDDDEVAGDNNGDGKITAPEVAGDTNGDGQVTSPEIIGDTDGNGIIDGEEVTGDRNGDGTIGSGETAGESETGEDTIAGDVNGDGQIGDDEIAGDTDGDGTITAPEVAGDTNGDGQIGDDEIAGDTDGDGTITAPEVAGDTNGDGQIGDGEIAGDTDGDGTITDPEVAGDTNGDGQIGNGEIAGDTDGDGQITDPEVAGDTDGNGQIDDDEVAGDNNGDGKITDPEVAGDTDGNGQINDDEVAGDTDGDGTITAPEIAGDTNGDGQVTSPEIIGDTDGNGIINDDEVTGDRNGDGTIGSGETAGESETEGSNIAGDTNGDGQITDPEVAGDTDGNGQIDDDEVAGDTNGDGKITDPEVAGDTDGNGQINDDERIGDVNGDGQITAPEIAGDADGNGVINNSETAEGSIANISILSIEENTYENPDSEIYYLIDCEDESNQVAVTFTPDAYATSPHVREFNIEIPGPGLYNEEINVVSEDGINTRTYRIVVEKRFNYNDIVIQKYNNVLLINNNPATNGGYRFTAFNWYKDGVLIGTGQYYSVGDNASDQLDLNAMYSVEIETEDGDVFSTCDFTVSYSNIFSLKVAPNPVRSGSTIDVTTTYTTDMLSDLTISVRNLYGVEVMQEMSGSNNSRITLPSSLTPGTYVVSTKAGGVELSAKIIVQ
nr:MBG domain-containing protein [uncultured Draconibacterium sp.]